MTGPSKVGLTQVMAGYVYILASKPRGTLYIGVTTDLAARTYRHRESQRGFTARYGVHRLVYFETFDRIEDAIARETRLKKWKRDWKIGVIEEHNPDWRDLYPGIAL